MDREILNEAHPTALHGALWDCPTDQKPTLEHYQPVMVGADHRSVCMSPSCTSSIWIRREIVIQYPIARDMSVEVVAIVATLVDLHRAALNFARAGENRMVVSM